MKAFRQLVTATLLLPSSLIVASCSSSPTPDDPGALDPGLAVSMQNDDPAQGPHVNAVTEAPQGFDGLPNGNCTPAQFRAAGLTFREVEAFEDGIGPLFNNTSCISCHESPRGTAEAQDPPNTSNIVFGGQASQISELRAGHTAGTTFTDQVGGSLVRDRANDRSIQAHVLSGNETQTLRLTLSTAGDGYVEAIDSNTLQAIANAQPTGQKGTLIQVPVLEAPGQSRAGRFGWKDQNASLLTFSGDAYVNEMGVTNRLFPTENTFQGTSVQGGPFDGKTDPEDDANDIDAFTTFMRCLKAPPRGPITANVTNGQTQFNNAGCAICHVGTITTAPAGTMINGGQLAVSTALGDKNIHPFSDFLLHDVGTGDGIVQNGGQGTRTMLRTAPLWGIGVRTRFMHDGNSLTVTNAIQRHANQGATAAANFARLSAQNQSDLVAFVFSL